jgi:hypothetical protein
MSNSKPLPRSKKDDEPSLSKNQGKDVRYRIRKQEEAEAESEIKEFKIEDIDQNAD